jgi:hypothetical protein
VLKVTAHLTFDKLCCYAKNWPNTTADACA